VLSGTLRPDAAVPGEGGTVVADRDHDGIADTSDNCPDLANTDQFNEDGDGLGDACDLCPQLADTAATAPLDSDGDHIGDACDPHPGVKDSLWLFEGFHNGIPTTWARSANWTPVGDKVRVTAAGNDINVDGDGVTLKFTSPSGTIDNLSLTTFIQVEARTGSLNDHEVGMSLYDPGTDKGIYCELDQDPQNSTHSNGILWLVDDGNLNSVKSFAWVNGTEYRLTMTRQGTNYTCSVLTPSGLLTATGTTNIAVPQEVNVFAFGATALVGSVQLIGTP
jgi:hypothetical protein